MIKIAAFHISVNMKHLGYMNREWLKYYQMPFLL